MRYTAAQRLDRLPECAFHRRLAAMIAAGIFFDTFDLYLAGGVMVAMVRSGWSTMAQNAHFVSAGFLGMLIGAIVAGVTGDRFGRRFSFQFNLLLFGLASLAAAAAPDIHWLIGLRFLMGLGLGAEVIVGYGMLGEFIPPAWRGKWAAILTLAANSSLLVATVAGYLIIPAFGWRWMFVIVGVGALATWFARKKLPESPRWLESVGRYDEADAIVAQIEVEVARGAVLPEPAVAIETPRRDFRVSDLFSRRLVRATLLGMTVNIVGFSALFGFIIWMPTFLVDKGLTLSSSLGYASLMATGALLGAGLAALLSDRWGRKRGIAGMSFVAAALGLLYPHAHSLVVATVLGLLLFAALYFCGTLAFSTYVPELFPTELRLRGTAMSNVAGRAASMLAPQVVVAIFQSGSGINGVTAILAALLVVQGVVVGLFGIETRNRPLDSQADSIALGAAGGPRSTANASGS
ncbi:MULTISPECIES: MFS transporter [Paraburkholderia]|uniref:MFS transporter n=1 Tax=Paraburkholderia TaxID=1822464 RepID=UPI00225381F9|nr:MULTISPECIES: MFS transporter [Paraburkholderia]MCX4163286.1 MFS transporter [Paraburkholderia megapolitana]MDN7158782.1 MFS transporter [Paraburkholderia sp. CHISQ3]MDQ6495829.1 MFS transporter [Paraburkholderia megapolitana]